MPCRCPYPTLWAYTQTCQARAWQSAPLPWLASSSTRQQIEHYKTHLFEEHLPRETLENDAVDALQLELDDFVESIRSSRPPRVSGQQARNAVALAEQILAKIHIHPWDDTADGPIGPHATPSPTVIPAPHWHMAPSRTPLKRREAG